MYQNIPLNLNSKVGPQGPILSRETEDIISILNIKMGEGHKGNNMIEFTMTVVSADTDDIDEDNSSTVYG